MEYRKFHKIISPASCQANYDLENLRVSYEIRKYKKNLKTACGHSLVSSFHCSNKLFVVTPIKYARGDTKSFRSSVTLLDFLNLLKIFCTGIILYRKTVKDKTDIFKKHLTIY